MAGGVAAALHELRRPLQVAMLALTGPGAPAGAIDCLDQAAAALEQLEHELGLRAAPRPDPCGSVAAEELLADARSRWCGVREAGCPAPISFAVAAPGLELRGDRRRLGAALDNLIANGLEHGAGEVRVELRPVAGGARLSVSNAADTDCRGEDDPRRGHGLGVVARTAAELGGLLGPPRRAGSEVVCELTVPAAEAGFHGTGR